MGIDPKEAPPGYRAVPYQGCSSCAFSELLCEGMEDVTCLGINRNDRTPAQFVKDDQPTENIAPRAQFADVQALAEERVDASIQEKEVPFIRWDDDTPPVCLNIHTGSIKRWQCDGTL